MVNNNVADEVICRHCDAEVEEVVTRGITKGLCSDCADEVIKEYWADLAIDEARGK